MVVALGCSVDALRAQTDLWLVPIAEDGTAGTPIPVATRPGYENQPSFSENGRRLYFTADTGGQNEIWSVSLDADGLPAGGATPLTRTPESEYSAVEMPSGGRFTVIRVEDDGAQRLWSFRLDGSDPELVFADIEPVGYHAWGDAQQVGMFVLGSPPTLVLARTTDGSSATLASDIGRSIHRVPNQRAISFTERVDGEGTWISVLDLDTREIRRVTRTTGEGQDYAWFPDGSVIMASGHTVHRWSERRGWRPLLTLEDLGEITRLAVHPNGRVLAVVAAEPEDDSP